MITTNDLDALGPPPPEGAVVSIGVFDGVHLGHRAILEANVRRAAELGARPTVVTFRDHPKQTVLGHAPRTLTSLEHRLQLFARAGIEHTLVLPFDETLRRTPAEAFLQHTLVEALGARAFVLGFDSRFGCDRRGTPDLLKELGLDVQVVGKVEVEDRAVSSTAIREAIELGDLEGAREMLGRRPSVLGTVVHGDERGRGMGFPTANLDLHHEMHPPAGVWAGWARVLEGPHAGVRPAVANLGVRPTVEGARAEPLLEVHLLDFDGDLYGARIEFLFARHLRGERRFAGLDELARQISSDVAEARALLAVLEAPPPR